MTTRASMSRAALAAFALAGALAWSPSSTGSKIAGSFTGNLVSQHGALVPDAPMHALALMEWRGTNRSTGDTEYMSGGSVTSIETNDLVQGNGPHQGYITFAIGADTSISKWNGKVTTVLGADKQPVTTFEGSWTKVGGTGRYSGATGSGTYKGRMLSPKEYAVDWRGELSGIKVANK